MDKNNASKEKLEFGEPLEGINYRHRPGAYAIILNQGNEVCLVRTPGGYALPGGGIEDGEEKEEALLREVMEETGYAVGIQQYIGTAYHYTHSDTEGYLKKECFYYACAFQAAEKEPTEGDHFPEWHSGEEALNKLIEKEQSHYWAVKTALSIRDDLS